MQRRKPKPQTHFKSNVYCLILHIAQMAAQPESGSVRFQTSSLQNLHIGTADNTKIL